MAKRFVTLRIVSSGATLGIVASCIVLLVGRAALRADLRSPASVILISVDTLRADHLSCYGYRRASTPHIDAVAQSGTLFTQVDSQVPLTLPSHVSLLTSRYPFANGVQDNAVALEPDAVTLA